METDSGQPNVIGEYVWTTIPTDYYYRHGKPVKFSGQFLTEGTNTMILRVPRDLNKRDWMYFAWYSLAYERKLKARADNLGFTSPDTTGTADFLSDGFSTAGTLYAFDVTDQFDVALLENVEETTPGGQRRGRFSSGFVSEKKHFWMTTTFGLQAPASIR